MPKNRVPQRLPAIRHMHSASAESSAVRLPVARHMHSAYRAAEPSAVAPSCNTAHAQRLPCAGGQRLVFTLWGCNGISFVCLLRYWQHVLGLRLAIIRAVIHLNRCISTGICSNFPYCIRISCWMVADHRSKHIGSNAVEKGRFIQRM